MLLMSYNKHLRVCNVHAVMHYMYPWHASA